ncbi:class I SAM-dependent methyltransferase, partial [Candidatus Bathyarchaeota archaeon]
KMNPKDYFDNAADTWDERFFTPKLSQFLEELVPQLGLTSGQNVLDVGTGTGVIIPFLIKAIGSEGSVTAIDSSEKMIQICKAKHSQFKNVYVQFGKIEEQNFTKETFDAVICFGVFPHLENKQKALRNIIKMLKSSGKIIIAHAMSREELKIHHKKVSTLVRNAILPPKTEMKKLLKQIGFTKISIKDEPGMYLCMANKD